MGKLKAILSILMIAALVRGAVKFLDAKMIAQLLGSISPGEGMVLALFPLAFVLPRALRFTLLLSPKTGKGRRNAVYGYCASQAVSAFPTGLAGRAAVIKSSGVPFQHNMLPLMTDSFFDLAYLAIATLAVAAFVPAFRSPAYIAVPLGILLAPLLLSRRLRQILKRVSFGWANRRGKVGVWRSMRRSFHRLQRPKHLVLCALLTLLANLSCFAALWWTVRSFDLEVPLATLMIALTVPTLLGRLVFLPGSGVSIVAGGMVAVLAHAGHMTPNHAAAVALIYRGVDMVLPSLYGWLLYLMMPGPSSDLEPGKGATATRLALKS